MASLSAPPSLSRPQAAAAGNALSRSNPFPGLRPYEEADSEWFFGRGGEINDLLKRLRRVHFLAIVGASGCGKSSVIRAGVLPQIRDGYLDADWSIAAFRPGERPLANLTEALCPELACDPAAFLETLHSGSLGLIKAIQATRPEPGRKVLILVDQFEELFQFAQRTGDSAQEEVKQFLKLLLTAAASDGVSVYVAVTMRLEWMNECATYVGLAEAINEGIYLVPQMARRSFNQAILGPLDAADGAMTSALLDRMLNDLDARSDQLPVLQHALLRLWERRAGTDPFDIADYEAVGTLSKCLSDHAEEVYGELSASEKRVAELLFRSITQVHKGRKMRRPRPLAEIAKSTGAEFPQLEAVIAAFSRAGRSFLVTTQGKLRPASIVDVSHEALIRQWGRLSDWVDDEAEIQGRICRIEEDAAEWDRDRRAFKTSLYRGAQLQRAEVLAPHLDPASAAAAFLKRGARARLLGKIWRNGAIVAAILLLIGVAIQVYLASQVIAHEQLTAARTAQQSEKLKADAAAQEAARAKAFQDNLVKQVEDAKGSATKLAAIAQSIQNQRVYLQYVRGQSIDPSKSVQTLLQNEHYSVPGIQAVSPDRSPATTQVRYFHDEDKSGANKIASLLTSLLKTSVAIRQTADPSNVVPSGQFEVWLAAAPITQQAMADKVQATIESITTNQTAEKKPETPAVQVAAPAAPTLDLTSSQSNIQQGQSVALSWQTANASEVSIEGIGSQAPTGSLSVTPQQSTTYNLVAKGPGGIATRSLRVEVVPFVAVASPPAAPSNSEPLAVKAAITRYKEAYESESLDDVKAAWPSISKAQQKNDKFIFDQFNAIRLSLICHDDDIHLDGDSATAACRQTAVYTAKGKKQPEQTSPVVFKLRKQAGQWVIDSIQ